MSRWIEFHQGIIDYARDFMPKNFVVEHDVFGRKKEKLANKVVFEPTDLVFAPNQPSCFWEEEGGVPYRGQDAAKERIDLYIKTLTPTERFKCLLVGPAGLGKTTLYRIIANRIRAWQRSNMIPLGPYYELLPAQIESKENLDQFMSQLVDAPGAIVAIDEIHTLTNLEAFYHVLHDTGLARYPMSDGSWIEIPSTIHWLAATTDPGDLDAAMRRRLGLEIRLEIPSDELIASIIQDQADEDGVLLHPDAGLKLAERAEGLPWRALQLYQEAKRHAQIEGNVGIALPHVDKAFSTAGVHELGLLQEDLDVIYALLAVNEGKGIPLATQPGIVRYKMSEASLCAAAGIDRGTYKQRIQPKLIRLGLLMPNGGQCLTDKAVRLYG